MFKNLTYTEAAINFGGISEDDMLKNVAKTLKEKAKKFTNMEWLPHPYQLEKSFNLPEELVKFLNWLKWIRWKTQNFISLGDILANLETSQEQTN